MPGTVSQAASTGPSGSEIRYAPPMLMPIAAMPLLRCSGRSRSASSAMIGAATAPAPCSARPAMMAPTPWAAAASTLPAENSNRPKVMTGLRPNRSDALPNGMPNSACVRPYMPSARPIMVGVAPGSVSAYSASTGSSRNRPSMRRM